MTHAEAARQIIETVAPASGPVWLSIVNGGVAAWTAGPRPSDRWRALGVNVRADSRPEKIAERVRDVVARVRREEQVEEAAAEHEALTSGGAA